MTERDNIKEISQRMYCFFRDFRGDGIPSFSKFARTEHLTLETLESLCKEEEFYRIWRECAEIRRDIIIDRAITRHGDGSFAKFLLGEESAVCDNRVEFTLTVVD